MDKKRQLVLSLILIILGVATIILTTLNLRVIMGQPEAFLAGEIVAPIPGIVIMSLNICQVVLMTYIIFATKLKKANLFWLLIWPLGAIVIGIHYLLRLNKNHVN